MMRAPARILSGLMLWVFACVMLSPCYADAIQDRAEIIAYFQKLFPHLSLSQYADGAYALDPEARAQWLEVEKFSPYEWAIDEGRQLFESGRYVECFSQPLSKIRGRYPHIDPTGEIITLELKINQCRMHFKQQALPYGRGDIAALSAYLAFQARAERLQIPAPRSELELAAYEAGKRFYYQRRGQLNFSCASCHVQSAGKRLRADTLSPMLGQVTHFPVYSGVWAEMGTLHRRFIGCLEQIRAPVFSAQSQSLRELEYYLSFISSGLPLNGPGYRK